MNTNEYQTSLQAELLKITEELQGIAQLNTETGDWVAVPDTAELGNADSNDTADAVETWEERRALMVQLETRYRNLVRALDKIATSTFGHCEICNEPIETKRLDVNQAARTCLTHLENESELTL